MNRKNLQTAAAWQVRAERIWHPTGAQEITGDILLVVRAVRREWRYGDRVRFWIRPWSRKTAVIRAALIMRLTWRSGIFTSPAFSTDDEEVELLARQPGASAGSCRKTPAPNPPFHRSQLFARDQRRVAEGVGRRRYGRDHQRDARRLYRRGGQSCAVDFRAACRHARFGGVWADSSHRFA